MFHVTHEELPGFMLNLAKYGAFKNRYGFNMESIDMSVETDSRGISFTFHIKVPGHVLDNIQFKAVEEVLFRDVPLPAVEDNV